MTKQVVIPLFAETETTKKTDNAKSFSDVTSNKRFLSLLIKLEPERQQKVIEKIKNKNINDLKKAIALIKKEEFMQNIEKQRKEIESTVLKIPEGVFDVIVINRRGRMEQNTIQ